MTLPSSRVGFLPFLTGLFLICMCVLMLQIMETRLLSVMAWYYLAFFAISMAMFGMTAGSLLVYFKSDWFPPARLFEHLSWLSVAFGIAVVLSGLSITTTVLLTEAPPLMLMLIWLKLILIIVPPYLFAGMAISLALTRSPWPVGIVYGVDLVGAATGCIVVLVLLTWLDGISALFAVGAIAAIAAACFRIAGQAVGGPAPLGISRWPVLRHPKLVAGALLALTAANTVMQPNGIGPILVKDALETDKPTALEWNSYSRVRVGPDSIPARPMTWGPSPKMPSYTITQRSMNIDGSAGTALYKFDGDLSKVDFLKYDVTNLGYFVRNQGRAAVIGVGGGRDVLSAHYFGFKDVTGIELNAIFIDLLQNRFRDFNRVAQLPGTRLFVDEARSWFAGTKERFDLIEMSLIDTWAATGAGAFSLSENGLYTVQGWQHFLNALTPDGIFTVSRWYNPRRITETGRLLSLANAALRSRGVTDPKAHIYLASAANLATIIVGAQPLSPTELQRLHQVAEELGYTELISPDRETESPILRTILSAKADAEFSELTRQYHIDFTAPTDDRPFFFNQLVLTDLSSFRVAQAAPDGVIRGNLGATKTIGIIVLLSAFLVVVTMILPAIPSVRRASRGLGWAGSAFFLLIGLGFMFIEIGIIQRASLFLGHPVHGLAIGLFGIILSTGIGSLISERLVLGSASRLVGWTVVMSLFIVALTVWFPSLVATFEGHGLATRALVSLLAIVPAGILMGFGFPTGMRLVNAIDTSPTPWFWAVNGAAGVLAASIAVGVGIAFSINASLWIGAACYLLLAPVSVALLRLGRG